MTCERHYTPSAVAELQAVSLAAELKRRIAHYREAFNRFPSQNGAMQSMALGMVEVWLEELAPVNQPAE